MTWTDYQGALGHNVMTAEEQKRLQEPPQTAADYALYRRMWESHYAAQTDSGGDAVLRVSATCEGPDAKGNRIRLKKPKDGHMGFAPMFACDHCIVQDPDNPEGMVFIPFAVTPTMGFFLCKTCFKLMERYKFNFGKDMKCKCGMCLTEAVERLQMTFPDRFKDLRER